jgi:hypothetical protein
MNGFSPVKTMRNCSEVEGRFWTADRGEGVYPVLRTLQPGVTPFRRMVRRCRHGRLYGRLTQQNALHPPERIATTIANCQRFD